MAGKGLNQPLSVQMDSLKKSMDKREEIRQKGRFAKMMQKGNVDPSSLGRRREGGGAAAAALDAVAAAGALAGPEIQVCEICNISFTTDGQMQQHLGSAAHIKARTAMEKRDVQQERLGRNRGFAEAAVAAANWQASQGGGSQSSARQQDGAGPSGAQAFEPQPQYDPPRQGGAHGGGQGWGGGGGRGGGRGQGGSGRGQSQQGGRGGRGREGEDSGGRGRGRGRYVAAPPPKVASLSHADVLAQAQRGEAQVLSIGGWVPPSIPMAAPSLPVQKAPAQLPEAQEAELEEAQESDLEDSDDEPVAMLAESPKHGQEEGGGGLGFSLVDYPDSD